VLTGGANVKVGYDGTNLASLSNGGLLWARLLHKLMHGVLYGGEYGWETGATGTMTDWPTDGLGVPLPQSQVNYVAAFTSNHGRPYDPMKIDVSLNAGNYIVEIYVGETLTYRDTSVPLTTLNAIFLQTHWGSGVIFSKMSIAKK